MTVAADRRQRVPRPQPFAEPRRLRKLSKHPVPLPPLTDGRALRRRQAGMKTSAEPGECSHLEARGNSAPPRPEQHSWRRRALRPGEGELSDRGDVPPDCQPNERLARPNARPSASWLLLLTSESGGRLFRIRPTEQVAASRRLRTPVARRPLRMRPESPTAALFTRKQQPSATSATPHPGCRVTSEVAAMVSWHRQHVLSARWHPVTSRSTTSAGWETCYEPYRSSVGEVNAS
jgi:hypothetical protein